MLDTGYGDPAPGQVGSAVFLAKAAVHVHMVLSCLHLTGARTRSLITRSRTSTNAPVVSSSWLPCCNNAINYHPAWFLSLFRA
jgi:hypothetical protein